MYPSLERGALLAALAVVCLAPARALAQDETVADSRAALSAGAIRGVIVDARTGAPIVGASVYVADSDQVAVSGDDGSFSVAAAGTIRLVVVDPRYQRSTIEAAPGALTRVVLEPVTLAAGEEIVVEAARVEPTPGATAMVREEITRVPGSRGDVLSAVKSLPGVANNGSLTPFSAGLVIRGASPQDSRILIDGFEIPILYHFLGLQSVLPSEMIDDLQLLPGGFDVTYGRSSAGIVSVRSRRGERELGGFAELSFVNAAGLVQGPIGEKGSFAIAARRSVIDALLPLAIPDDANLDFLAYPRYYDYQGRIDWQQDERVRLSAFVFGTDDGVELLNDNDNTTDPALTGNLSNDTSFTRAILSASYETPGVRGRVGLSAYTDTNHTRIGDRFLLLDRDAIAARAEGTIAAAGWLDVDAGAEVESTRLGFDLSFVRPPREGDPQAPSFSYDQLLEQQGSVTNPHAGAWLSATARPVSWLETRTGVRVDGYLRPEEYLVQPRGSVRVRVADGTTLLAAGGLYSRAPEDNDENLQDLAPERSTQITAGIEQTLAGGLSLQVTGFDNRLSDLAVLTEDRREMATDAGYQSVGEGRAYGAEALLSLRRADAFGWVAYTLSRSTRTDGAGMSERLFDYDQTHNLIVVGSYRLGDRGQWQLGGRFQLTTGKPYTPVVGAMYQADVDGYQPVFGEINSERVATQHQLDLRVDRSWQFQSWKLSAYLDISNVYLNAAVVDYAYNFDYSDRQDVTTLPIIPSLGIRGEL